jgi:hypothetical protein
MEKDMERIIKYEPPTLEKAEKMTFATDWLNDYSLKKQKEIYCRQCSSCHGCR